MDRMINSIYSYGQRLNDVEARIEFLNEYLPLAIKKRKQNTEKMLDVRKMKIEDELLPLAKAAGIETEFLLEEKESKIKNTEEKYYWLDRKIKQSKKRDLEKKGNDMSVKEIEEEYKSKIEENEQAKLAEIQKIKDEYEKLEGNLDDKRNLYYEREKQFSDIYEQEKRLRLEKDSKSIDKLTEKTTMKIDKLKLKRDKFVEKIDKVKKTKDSYVMDDDVLIKLDNLSMHFGGLKAVDHLSFDVKKGEIFGLIGPNGAGKTTVFNCITQFYKSKYGNIYYSNRNNEIVNLNDYRVHNVIKEGIVRTFQNVELVWELSILDNLLVGGHTLFKTNFFHHMLNTRRIKQEEMVLKKKAEDILSKLGLLAYKDVSPYGLPYGILKKIELARTLMINPRLIILDEPAAGLNDAETAALAKFIRQIRDDYQATIFLVEHDMGLVMDICDRICAINFGKKLAIGTPKEIQNSQAVRDAYLGGE